MNKILFAICLFITSQAFAGKRVVVVSWDGFRPEFLTNEKYKTPYTRKLMNEGAYSLDLEPINPTLTYPNHTAMVTGVPSSVHGILSNTVFDSVKGPQAAWYWESDKIKVTPLWKKAYEEGKKTAILGWPVTVGGKATWLLPETFAVAGMTKTNEELIRAESDPAALKEIETALNAKIPTENELPHDEWLKKAAIYLETKHHPDLQLVHLANVDHWQHESGTDSKETQEAVAVMDQNIGDISAALKDQGVCLIVLGDHGHANYQSVTNINVILADLGWIELNKKNELVSWKAIAHSSGSQAAIYVKNKADRKAVLKALKEELKDGFNVLEKQQFKKLNIYPDADFVVISKIGHALSGAFKDKEVEVQTSAHATHGYLGSSPEMKTVFIASGCGIKPKKIGKMSMLQVAPTISKLLGIKLKTAQKKAVL